jgi:pimeloyl-[acyl-carrier protein] methyl ester esterase
MINRLVLLPGMHGTGELFSEFTSRIPEPKHLEALYYPMEVSFSYSQLLEVVQSFVPASDPYFLLAESFSTPLAIQFAATRPTNLKGLILCAGLASSPLTGPSRFAASLLAPLLFRLPVFDFAMNFLIGRNAPDSLQAAVRAAVSAVKPDVLTARLRAVLSCDQRQALSRVAVPMLYIQATKDKVIPKSCLEEIRLIKPDVRVVEIGGPHLILQREPKQSANIVAKFIEEFQ